jgi:hypothetical protein
VGLRTSHFPLDKKKKRKENWVDDMFCAQYFCFSKKINSQCFDTWFKVQPLLMPEKLDFQFLDKQQNTCFF